MLIFYCEHIQRQFNEKRVFEYFHFLNLWSYCHLFYFALLQFSSIINAACHYCRWRYSAL